VEKVTHRLFSTSYHGVSDSEQVEFMKIAKE
jgi:hypothetical protein